MLKRTLLTIPDPPSGVAPSLPLLVHVDDLRPADWLRESMTTFARDVSSILPGHFDAYARIFHPFVDGSRVPTGTTWHDAATAANADLTDRNVFEALRSFIPANAHSRNGTASPEMLMVLTEHLQLATTTPESCLFAVWEGFGMSAIPGDLEPKLDLPRRRYHLFAGPIQGARTNFNRTDLSHQSANLWWPADHAWCVATEIDFQWTYVGGARSCIRSLLADPRLEAVETDAASSA